MATMKQIANLAGVSLGTVDRVLNNRGIVNADTAKRIMEIAQSLDYIPNKTARALAIRKQNIKIGCVIISPAADDGYAQVEKAIEHKASDLAEYNISVLIKHVDPSDPCQQNTLIDELVSCGVKGILLCGFNLPSTAEKINQLIENGIPVVTTGSEVIGANVTAHVGSNSKKVGRVAGQLIQMISNGSARIAIIVYGPERNLLGNRARVQSFIDYVDENKESMSIAVLEGNYDDDFKSYSVVESIMKNDPEINTIFIVSSGVYGACKAVELISPEKRPKVFCLNCVPSTEEMLKKGVISAAISLDPRYHGEKPLDILFNLICYNVPPKKKEYFAKMDIVISEALND